MIDLGEAADLQEQELARQVKNVIIDCNKTTEQNENPEETKNISIADTALLQKVIRTGLVTSKNDVEVQRKDPNSPLYSVKSFEALHLKPNILKGVYSMGYNAPSKIQETALPALLADPPQNMIAQSQSGTGKTAAFVIAMLSRVEPSHKYPQVICLSPTLELALQIGQVIEKIGRFCTDIHIRYAVTGENIPRGMKLTEQVIIGTPGKVFDWATKFRCLDLSKIRVCVLDEADIMIDTQGLQDQSIRIHNLLPRRCQMMLFSVTYNKDVMQFAECLITNPNIIRLKREEESLGNIRQYYVNCSSQEIKYKAIAIIYSSASIGQAIIFFHTRKKATWLAEKLTHDGHGVGLLSGEPNVDQRITVLESTRKGNRVLITTNVAARGIDIEQVSLVVNFDLPVGVDGNADCETYLHRIGRTGRFGRNGLAINMVDGPKAYNTLKQIENHFDRKIIRLDTDNLEEVERLTE
ncbi:ATP-dependent RNA helicase DDX19A-like [Artemia franciscana]|uniref:ATP-dependent RNA helicase DDX19A-like n=1 Tax=Artemia franciscana TaxID=6661 RepID=UPI0032DA8194